MRAGILFRILLLAAMLAPLGVGSNSPALTWYRFKVHGRVIRPAGSLDHYTVILLKRSNGEWSNLQTCNEYTFKYVLQPVALTNEKGGFSLIDVHCAFEWDGLGFDTLAVAVVLPDTTLIGNPFRLDGVSPSVTTGTCGGDYGCDGGEDCAKGYTYAYPPRNISIP